VFFAEQSVEAISSAVRHLAGLQIDSSAIMAHASQFGRDPFFIKMRQHIEQLLAERPTRI
jgi:hypothetical protein